MNGCSIESISITVVQFLDFLCICICAVLHMKSFLSLQSAVNSGALTNIYPHAAGALFPPAQNWKFQ